jgi:hypothetical protein
MKATLTILLSSLSLIALAQPLIDDAIYIPTQAEILSKQIL